MIPRRTILTICLCCLATITAFAAPSRDKVGLEVHERLSMKGRARVVVFLEIESTDSRRLDVLRQRTFDVQRSVLDTFESGEFDVIHRYAVVPALAGELNAEGLKRLVSHAKVVRVDLDEGGAGNLAQAVPLTDIDDVHSMGLSGEGVTVAVLDSGIDTDHLDLADDLVGQACFCYDYGAGCCPSGGTTQLGVGAAEDDHGHGSNVAGIVTSGGVVSSVGTAPDASLVVVKVLDEFNSFCCSSDIVAGLDWIAYSRPDVDVVNVSLGSNAMFSGNCDNSSSWTLALSSAINTLRANGVLTFVSTGNTQSTTQMQAPACIANAISVAAVWDADVGSKSVFCFEATTAADKITCFSNRNSLTDIFGPGAPTTSDYLDGGLSSFYGTSQASPLVAGCAANLLEEFPGLDPTLLETALESNGVTITDHVTGREYPRVDCDASVISLACRDGDSDGYHVSALCPLGVEADCDDDNDARFPGNPETCDFLDNDCDGMLSPPELSPPDRVDDLVMSKTTLAWAPDALATGYDVIVGNLGTLRATGGDFASATSSCLANDHGTIGGVDPPIDPPPGAGTWIAVRPINCSGDGSYDSGSPDQEGSRDAGIAASGIDCP